MVLHYAKSLTSKLLGRRRERAKIAAFVTGDHRIFFPAIVALTSVHKYNPEKFDLFISFEGARLTAEMQSIMEHYDIGFIDSHSLDGFEKIKSLTPMSEGTWPVEVFLNWVLPEHLLSLGYGYSLKLDYDVLCINSYRDLDALMPTEHMMSIMRTGGSTYVPEPAAAEVIQRTGFLVEHESAMNVGVILFNNFLFKDHCVLEKVIAVYSSLSVDPNIPVMEQVAVAIVAHNIPNGFKLLPSSYNQRVRRHYKITNLANVDFFNIHYITKLKPWKPLRIEDVTRVVKQNAPALPFYRNIWIEYAQTILGFERFCDQRPLGSRELLAMALHAFRTMEAEAKAKDAATTQPNAQQVL